MKQVWPAPERNKAPILEVLVRVLPPGRLPRARAYSAAERDVRARNRSRNRSSKVSIEQGSSCT